MSRARDLADSASGAQLVDITSSFTRNANWVKWSTERVYHDPVKDLVHVQLALYVDATTTGGTADWQEPANNTVLYTIASPYHPAEQFLTTNITGIYDSSTVVFDTNGEIRLDSPMNWESSRFRVAINCWYRI